MTVYTQATEGSRRKPEHFSSRSISIMPTFCAWWYVHEFIKFLHVNVTALPLHKNQYEIKRWRILRKDYLKHQVIEHKSINTRKSQKIHLKQSMWTYPSYPVMENCRTWMIFTCCLMVILLFKDLATSFISASLGLIQANYFLDWSRCDLNLFIFYSSCHNSWLWRPGLGTWRK